MSFINFRSEDKVHLRSIDIEHQQIVHIIDSLHNSVMNFDEPLVAKEMQYLLELLQIHFGNEERLMTENKFPGYISHKLEHDRFYRNMLNSVQSHPNGKIIFGIEELESIRRWFFNHIEINDRKCATFLIEKGIS